MATLFIIKFGLGRMKFVGGVAVWIFCSPIGFHVNEYEKK